MIPRLIRKLFSVEVLGPVLVLLSLQMLAYGISSSLRETDTNDLFKICLVAAGFGWMLSKSKLSGFYSALIVAALGCIGIWIVGARLALPLLEWIQSLGLLVPQMGPAIREKIPFDTSLAQETWGVIIQASSALASRWQTWMMGIDKNTTVNDPLIRNMIWSLVMWCFAAWTGWHMARRNAILALLPGIGLMALVLSYSEYRIYSLWVMVILLLLLMGIWNYKNHTIQWEWRKVDYSDSILYDNTQAVVFLALLIGTIAFAVPSISWRDIQEYLRERNSSEAAEMLGIRKQTVPAKDTYVQKPSLPREHLLTEGFALSQDLVMTIHTGELPPIANPSIPANAPRYYWRSTVYDEYMGAGWITSYVISQNNKPNTPLIPGLLDNYRPLHLDVQLQQPEGKLFWSGILYSADVPFRADWRVRPQSSLFADQTELLQADLFAAVSGAPSYRAETYIPVATIQQLRSASTQYPEEIRTRYLKLPRNVTWKVHDLAAEITKGKTNPYDKAKAIESYLRTNYPYDLEVPAPPEGQDVAEYFLFDLKRGYCDYYATAMVVLARASGLPARFVSGYASGLYDAANAQYVVRELNAHSWPEVYFPEIGWIEFEPTASQPEIERMEMAAEIPATEPPATTAQKFLFKLTNTGFLYWASPFGITLLLVVLYFIVLERIWILSRSPADAIGYLYRRYYRLGRPLAGTRTRAETAYEFTNKLVLKIEDLQKQSGRVERSRRLHDDVQQLTNLYLLSLFSNHATAKDDARCAFNIWRRLRRQLMVARFNNWISAGRKKLRPRWSGAQKKRN